MYIQKPMSIARADFINGLVDLINNSDLPPYVIEPILKDVAYEVGVKIKEQLEQDKEEYALALQNQMSEENKEKEKVSKRKARAN